jgi:hypothetical protein
MTTVTTRRAVLTTATAIVSTATATLAASARGFDAALVQLFADPPDGPSEPSSRPSGVADAELQTLGAEFRRLADQINAGSEEAYEQAYERFCLVRDRIEALPAATAAGMRIKADAYLWHVGELGPEEGSPELRMASSLVRDVLAQL